MEADTFGYIGTLLVKVGSLFFFKRIETITKLRKNTINKNHSC